MTARWRLWLVRVGVAILIPAVGVAAWGRATHDGRLLAAGGAIGFGTLFLMAIPNWVPTWRGDTPEAKLKAPPGWWPFSAALWQGWVRSSFFYGVFAGPMFLLAAFVIGVSEADWPVSQASLGAWYPRLELLAIGFFLLVNGLGFSIIAINRPRFLVPPSMRDQYGWFDHLDTQRRSR